VTALRPPPDRWLLIAALAAVVASLAVQLADPLGSWVPWAVIAGAAAVLAWVWRRPR
jgi:hypothetical protein